MKTIKFTALLLCAFFMISCQKSKGPEKSGNFPKKFVYAGPEAQPTTYFQWKGNNAFTELPDVEFPEEYKVVETMRNFYATENYPIAEITLESDSLVLTLSTETPLDPPSDITIAYIQIGNVITANPSTFPIAWYLSDDESRLEIRGYGHNFNYYDNSLQARDYFTLFLGEGARNERSEMELLDDMIAENQDWIMPNDTIQLMLYEVVFELE